MHHELDRFLAHLGADGTTPASTLRAYRTDLTQFLSFLAERGMPDLQALQPADLHAFCAWLAARGYATATVARRVAALRALGAFLVQAGLLAADPCADLHPPPVTRPPRRLLTPEQIDALRERMLCDGSPDGWRDRAILEVLAATALRASYLVALDLADLSLEERTITVRCTGKTRRVSLTPAAVMALAAYLQLGRPKLLRADPAQPALFLNQHGQRLTRQGCWVVLKGYARQLGLDDVTPERLRQSVAAHRFAAGASVDDVQALLDHAVRKTTLVYQPSGPATA